MRYFSKIFFNRRLIWSMIIREIESRYKETFFGLFWAISTPVFMLVIYTFVFTKIFNGRWETAGTTSQYDFAIILFLGLIIYNFLAEILTLSPNLIVNNKNFVKKMVFPLEVLPAIAIGNALFHGILSFIILLIFQLFARHYIPPTFLFFPVMFIPFILLTMGVSLFIASLGVFIRDLNQIMRPLITALLFLAPIIYPSSVLPEFAQRLILINPLSFMVEQAREVVIFGNLPNFFGWIVYITSAFFTFIIGVFVFEKTKNAFADVL